MPAPRVPTSILEARGTFKKDPQRGKARENEPIVTDSIGDPPTCFLPNADGFHSSQRQEYLALWYELIADAAPGVLNRSHRSLVELACTLKYLVRHGTASTGDRTNFIACLRQMGMTPAAQSTVSGGAFTPAGSTSPIGRLARQAQRRA